MVTRDKIVNRWRILCDKIDFQELWEGFHYILMGIVILLSTLDYMVGPKMRSFWPFSI